MYNNINNFFRLFFSLIAIFFVCFCSNTTVIEAHADTISIADYSYKKVYNALPTANQKDTFVYESASNSDAALLALATYEGSDYKTFVKHKKNSTQYLYCINHNKNIDFTDTYVLQQSFFNVTLRKRLGILFYNGPKKWGEKASAEFTTGNSILDYYMTQIVVHSLIYDYGNSKSDLGIDFAKVTFKDNTGLLEKKTKALYNYCCNAKLTYEKGYFQSSEFSLVDVTDHNLYLNDGFFVSSTVSHETLNDIAPVSSFFYIMDGLDLKYDMNTILVGADAPFSDFYVKIPFDYKLDELSPGIHKFSIVESVTFNRAYAGLYVCSEEETSQELGTLLYDEANDQDQVEFELLIGSVNLYKTDSITGEPITDASFQIQEYNSNTKQYEPYCNMTYNESKNCYESSNLYLSVHNQEGKFKIIETKASNNYELDWEGSAFRITEDCYLHEFYVENSPVLGSITIEKLGEQWSYSDSGFSTKTKVPLPDVKFALYANENIYVKNNIMYQRDQKIVDMVTDDNGEIRVSDLPMGEYYVIETVTLDDYILDSVKHYFVITRDNTRKYSDVSLSICNKLKQSDVRIFKCYYETEDVKQKNPIPLKNALFGIYIKEDLRDCNNNIILKKDSCVGKRYSDDNGMVSFEDLPHVEYYIKELEAPDGFVLNDGIVTFELEDFQYDDATKSYIAYKEIVNEQQEFSIQIDKTGEDFTGALQKDTEHGSYYQYLLGNVAIEDVSFSLYDSNKQLIDTKKTDTTGKVSFDDLIAGTYYVSETGAPEQYYYSSELSELQIKQDNKEYNAFYPTVFSKSYNNELCECAVELTKLGEHALVTSDGIQYEYQPLDGVVFGIYQNFDYVFSGTEKSVAKDSCVGYIVTNQDGIGTFNGKIPCGEYYIKEISTLSGYDIDSDMYLFTVSPNNNKVMNVILNQDGEPFVNELSKATVKICKTDADTGKSLKGVEFTLYNTKDEKIGVYKTNRKGEITVKDLPYGEYYFVETKCKKGYYSTNNKYYFELNSKDTITLDITNSPIVKLGFREEYNVALASTLVVLIVLAVIVITNVWYLYRNKRKCDD